MPVRGRREMLVALRTKISHRVPSTADIGNERLALAVNDEVAQVIVIVHFTVVSALRRQYQ